MSEHNNSLVVHLLEPATKQCLSYVTEVSNTGKEDPCPLQNHLVRLVRWTKNAFKELLHAIQLMVCGIVESRI